MENRGSKGKLLSQGLFVIFFFFSSYKPFLGITCPEIFRGTGYSQIIEFLYSPATRLDYQWAAAALGAPAEACSSLNYVWATLCPLVSACLLTPLLFHGQPTDTLWVSGWHSGCSGTPSFPLPLEEDLQLYSRPWA